MIKLLQLKQHMKFLEGIKYNCDDLELVKRYNNCIYDLDNLIIRTPEHLDSLIYVKLGMLYAKLYREDYINFGAMKSWNNGKLENVNHNDIGKTPSLFDKEVDFYNPLHLTSLEYF